MPRRARADVAVIRRLYRGETRIDFIGNRERWYFASLVMILICIGSIGIRGFNYGIEFAGGTQFQIPVTGTSITTAEVNTAFAQDAKTGGPAQVVGSGTTKQIVVKTESLTPAKLPDVKTRSPPTSREPAATSPSSR